MNYARTPPIWIPTSGFQDGLILKTYFIGIYLFDFISPGKRSIQ